MSPIALTIAGSDPSGGAGLQADLKTFHQHGVYGASVVTLLTVQNTQRVSAVEVLAESLVLAQLDAVLEDLPPQAAKTGALGSASLVRAVAARAASFTFPLVVDPVMVSKHGTPLMDDATAGVLRNELLPRAFLVTPNLREAALLADMDIADLRGAERAAAIIAGHGPRHVLIKGNRHQHESVDVLWSDGQVARLAGRLIPTQSTHGSGCALSAAITARLACGNDVLSAVAGAKRFVSEAIRTAPGLGHGCGPLNLHADVG